MEKKKLLALIDQALDTEEEAIQSFTKHISAAIEWCGCNKEENKKILSTLEILAKESKQHKSILENLREEITHGSKNDI